MNSLTADEQRFLSQVVNFIVFSDFFFFLDIKLDLLRFWRILKLQSVALLYNKVRKANMFHTCQGH